LLIRVQQTDKLQYRVEKKDLLIEFGETISLCLTVSTQFK